MTAGDVWRGFGRWRHRRPFWGCLFLFLAGLELFYTANASIAGLKLHLGPTGFLSYLIPLILVICALLCLFTPAQRMFYGIVGLLDALYSFIGLNLGGFFIGMLLGIIGGALVIAWGPPRIRPVNPDFIPIADQIAMEQEASQTGEIKPPADSSSPSSSSSDSPSDSPSPEEAETEQVEVAGHDDRPSSDLLPGFEDDQEGPKSGPGRSRFSRNPKALTVAFIVMGLTAAMLAVGSRVPASAAADCPKGLPSRAASATPSRTTAAADKAAAGSASSSSSGSSSDSGKSTSGGSSTTGGSSSSGGSASTATPTVAPSTDKDGNPISGGVKGVVGGLGNLLGLGDGSSSDPSTSPTTPATPTAAPTTTGPEPTKTADPDPTATGTTEAPPSGTPTTAPESPKPSATDDDIPCLGPRVLGLNADADGIPRIGDKPGLLETDSLQMFESTYDGVVNLPTGSAGSARVLKFSMDKAVNKPFSLTIDEANGGHTVIKSNELTTAGHVKFFTQRFEGKLFGLIPVVFTPDSPPPLTLPYLWFTDVKIQLNYVQCDTLTGFPLQIDEK